jgi:hypothetical protein
VILGVSNPKLQAPPPNTLPNSNEHGIWDLGVRWSLELGAWDLTLQEQQI